MVESETITIREAVINAKEIALKNGVPEAQAGMVACLAVKSEMDQTVENLKALGSVMADVRCGVI